jgi:transaldolase
LDNIRRGIISSGELQALITQGIVGITSNPTIFEKAISGSADYDQELGALAARGLSAEDIYEALAVDDIRAACALLLPAYRGSAGVDGRVGTLRDAQALADLRVLRETGRRVIRVHLGDDIDGGLVALASMLAVGLS